MYEDTAPTPRQGVYIGYNRSIPKKEWKTEDGVRSRRRPYDIRDHAQLWVYLLGVIVFVALVVISTVAFTGV
jgi:hypothetical protein